MPYVDKRLHRKYTQDAFQQLGGVTDDFYASHVAPKYAQLSKLNDTIAKLFFQKTLFAKLDNLHTRVVQLDQQLTSPNADLNEAAESAEGIQYDLDVLASEAARAATSQSVVVAVLTGGVATAISYVLAKRNKHKLLISNAVGVVSAVTAYNYSKKTIVK